MNRPQFLVLLWMGIACLCLSLVTLVTSNQSRKAQGSLRSQQEFIGKGALSQQIGANLLREMATRAKDDEKMRDLLQKYGFNLSQQPAAPSPSSP
jgi:hypothetical protein